MAKKTIAFNVNEVLWDEARELFGTFNEASFLLLFNAYKSGNNANNDCIPVETYNTLLTENGKKDEEIERLRLLTESVNNLLEVNNESQLIEALKTSKSFALSYVAICEKIELNPHESTVVLTAIENLLEIKKSLSEKKETPTVDAPVVNAICELLSLSSILEAPAAIKNLLKDNKESISAQLWLETLPKFTRTLLTRTAEVLTARYNRTVSETDILVDMFLRYTVERWNEWFYDFAISKTEILVIAKEINPQIKTYQDVESAIRKGM